MIANSALDRNGLRGPSLAFHPRGGDLLTIRHFGQVADNEFLIASKCAPRIPDLFFHDFFPISISDTAFDRGLDDSVVLQNKRIGLVAQHHQGILRHGADGRAFHKYLGVHVHSRPDAVLFDR